jgi:hypothetical protein
VNERLCIRFVRFCERTRYNDNRDAQTSTNCAKKALMRDPRNKVVKFWERACPPGWTILIYIINTLKPRIFIITAYAPHHAFPHCRPLGIGRWSSS